MSGDAGAGGSVLVIKPSSLGDVVHTLPAVALLKKAYPGGRIAWLVNSDWAPLLEGNPHVDEVIIFPRRRFRGLQGVPNIAIWANAMRKRRFDLVLDFQGLLRSALVARLVRCGRVNGLSDAREGARLFYRRTVVTDPDQHAVERYLRLIADLGIDTQRPPEFPLPAGEKPQPFFVSGPYLLLHPFARGPGKSMPEAEVRAFCHEVLPIPVVVAGKSDKTLDLPRNCINMLNKTTLPELIWLIRNAHYVVSVDSGPMHMAAALGGNLLAIHRWSDPRLVGPHHPDAWVLKDGKLFQMKNAQRLRPADTMKIGQLPDLARFVREQFGALAGR